VVSDVDPLSLGEFGSFSMVRRRRILREKDIKNGDEDRQIELIFSFSNTLRGPYMVEPLHRLREQLLLEVAELQRRRDEVIQELETKTRRLHLVEVRHTAPWRLQQYSRSSESMATGRS
jgi:hypothetical protein